MENSEDKDERVKPEISEGVLYPLGEKRLKNEGREAEGKVHKEKIQAELFQPVETVYYTPQVYYVDEINVTGEEANLWTYTDNYCLHEGEIYINDYLGTDDYIVIPTWINGKRVTNLAENCLETCKASTVEIPGSFKKLMGNISHDNKNIKSIIIGEGVEKIGDYCFASLKNLSSVKVSKSVIRAYKTSFRATPWYTAQENLVIIGSVLSEMKQNEAVLNIPQGVSVIEKLVAENNKNLTKVILPESVTTLCESAFNHINNKSIQEIIYTDSLTNIGSHAFGNNQWTAQFTNGPVIIKNQLYEFETDSSSVTIPEGVTKICDKVFFENKNITQVTLPKTLKIIGEEVFAGCVNLRSIRLPKGLEVLEKGCFKGCKKLKRITIPNTVKKIGMEAFTHCNTLAEVKIGSSVEVIEDNAFSECGLLKSVDLNKNVRIIGNGVFENCIELNNILLPESVQEIGNRTFCGCESLKEINIPSGVTKINHSVFKNCTSLKRIFISENIQEYGYSAFLNCVALEEIVISRATDEKEFSENNGLTEGRFNTKTVAIGSNAFFGCTKLTYIKLPDSITEIDKGAFSGCTNLKDITLPNTLRTIDESAFRDCVSFERISIPNSVTVIRESAFNGCANLKDISIPDTLSTIDKSVFRDCVSLEHISIPNSVTVIGENTFNGCTGLKEIALPNTLRTIDESAFRGCAMLEYVNIPDTVTTLSDNAFKDCVNLTEVSGADHIEDVGVKVFANTPYRKDDCADFEIKSGVLYKYLGKEKNVIIPPEVTTIRTEAFLQAYQVETITFPDTVRTIENNLFGYIDEYDQCNQYQLRKLIIGNGVTSIGDRAFKNCKNLTDVVFGTALTCIGEEAFAGCSNLREIDLGNTAITKIKECAFAGCINVKKLILPPKVEFIESSAFSESCNGTVKLPKSVKKIDPYAFNGASELIVYDTIDPDSVEAGEWYFDETVQEINSSLVCPLFCNYHGSIAYFDYRETEWCSCHITVLSSETEQIRYRIFCDGEEQGSYREIMCSVWGKHASFLFEQYDNYFLNVRSPRSRFEMAFCRLQYPEGLSEPHRTDYMAYLKQCMYIESSAKRNAEIIGAEDAVERLAILKELGAIDNHNLGWIKESMLNKDAKQCLKFINENF